MSRRKSWGIGWMSPHIGWMQQQLSRHLGEHAELDQRDPTPRYAREGWEAFRCIWGDMETPRLASGDQESPRPIRDNRDEFSEDDQELSMWRFWSLWDRESTHHGSVIQSESATVRSLSYRVQQGTNPLLGRYLEEDMGQMEQPIISKPAKPMFTQRSGEEVKGRVPNSLELNQIFKEYSRLNPRLRRERNFNCYLQILGLKRNNPHGQRNSGNSWDERRNL